MLNPDAPGAVRNAGAGATATLPALNPGRVPAPNPRHAPEPEPDSLLGGRPLDGTALDAGGPDASRTTRRPAPAAADAHLLRARCLALGGLLAMVAAVGLITAVTLGTPRPPVAVAAKIPVAPRYWIVRPGQTLISIAARESISPSAVRRANPALIGRSLRSGQRVRLPS
jgi:LysM repeat protein